MPVKRRTLKYIELFAGCGGMSLGLEASGFRLFFANEFSPMAAETYAYNIINEDIRNNKSENTLWIKSQFSSNNINERLKENPFEASKGQFSDINKQTDLKGKLLVGDINQLLELFEKNPFFVEKIKAENIDLISGGPPCQSFSLAGKRNKNDKKNTLPLKFAEISGLIQPKVILLENVRGITTPFIENGIKYYAWLEVAKAFAMEGYAPVCMLLNTKYFGVPQNRPRFILLAFRIDIINSIISNSNNKTHIFKESLDFYNKVQTQKSQIDNIGIRDIKFYDIEKNFELFDGFVFPKITTNNGKFITSSEAIGDIRRTKTTYKLNRVTSGYVQRINETFVKKGLTDSYVIKNHEPRVHNFNVKARFRFYQVINEFDNGLKKSAIDLFTGKHVNKKTLEKLFDEFSSYNLFFENGSEEYYKCPSKIDEVKLLINNIPTKKHSQRALKEFEPAPAQLTIPDDICHYHMENLRTMTVREIARFQSFPDWFEFKSKVTTGGKMRRFEVPQYTQVGNAVPPLLAKSLGEMISGVLKEIL